MAQKKALTKKAILDSEDLPLREVDVPEWGGVVYLRGMTGEERAAYEDETVKLDHRGQMREFDVRRFRISMVARCLVDEKGDRIFTDKEMAALNKKSGVIIDRLYDIAADLSGVSEEDLTAATENLENGQNADSGTD